ncbi:MAG: ABC transporter permease, partial [Longimicrobiales bacterium]
MRLARWLTGLIRGPDGDVVRGDLHESWDAADDGSWRARGAHLRDVVATVGAWWRPSAVRRRRRLARRHPTTNPTGGGGGMGGAWRDLKLAVRKVQRRPRAAWMVVGVLGLGIGATTAVFSVVDGVMLRALPSPAADRLVAVGVTFPGREWSTDVEGLQRLAGVSYPNFVDVRDRAHSLDRLVGLHRLGALLPDGPAGPELVGMMAVTEGFFETLGVRPHVGRLFGPDDYAGRTGSVALLSHGTWRRRYGGDPGVVGRPISSEGAAQIIVGVLPPGFRPPEAVAGPDDEFWVPLDRNHPRYEGRGTRSLTLLGRLAPGATVDEARTELHGLAADLARTSPDGNVYPDGSHFGWGANRLRAETVGATGRTLLIFLGAAGLLLAIAVLNATNLLLVRSLESAGDLGVRTALGASRGSLVRQKVVEGLVLALAGGLVGTGLAAAAGAGFRRLAPDLVPRMDDVTVDLRVLGAAVALSALVGVAAGLVPALRVGAGSVAQGLRRSAGAVAGGRSSWMDGVVAVQVALALVLVTGGTLLARSFVELRSVDPGFDPEGVTTFSMGAKRGPDAEPAWQAWDALLDEVRATP